MSKDLIEALKKIITMNASALYVILFFIAGPALGEAHIAIRLFYFATATIAIIIALLNYYWLDKKLSLLLKKADYEDDAELIINPDNIKYSQ